MAYGVFKNQTEFDKYHDHVCADEGIPTAYYDTETGEPAVLDQWTEAFTEPRELEDEQQSKSWIARIPDEHLVTYAADIEITAQDSDVFYGIDEDGMPSGTVTVLGVLYTIVPNTLKFKKPKPQHWTDPKTGKTYDTATGEEVVLAKTKKARK